MINTSKNKFKILVNSDLIGDSVHGAVKTVLKHCKKHVSDKLYEKGINISCMYRHINSDTIDAFKKWDESHLQRMADVITDGSSKLVQNVDPTLKLYSVSKRSTEGVAALFKMLAIQLWIDRIVLIPFSMRVPGHYDDILDEQVESSGIGLLVLIRGAQVSSSLESDLNIDYRRANRWFKLLMCTTMYDEESFTDEEIVNYLDVTHGGGSIYSSTYPRELLSLLADRSNGFKEVFDRVMSKIDEEKEFERSRKKRENWRKSSERKKERRKLEGPSKGHVVMQGVVLELKDFSDSKEKVPEDLGELLALLSPYRLQKIVGEDSALFAEADNKIKTFVHYFTEVFYGWLEELNLQKEGNHKFTLALMRAYLLTYLPRFFNWRDKGTDRYPTCFNEFFSPYFISRNDRLSKLMEAKRAAPITLLSFVKLIADLNKWGNETYYTRVLIVDNFFNWVADNQASIPKSDEFKNTISDSDYPPISRGQKTVKKPVPRKYFATLISLCYTLEYLVEHINSMAYGDTPVCVREKIGDVISQDDLKEVSLDDLENHPRWANLWGNIGAFEKLDELAFTNLNYCPVFFHEDKAYQLENCKRFYTLTSWMHNGQERSTISPHLIRILIIMCETGIRQMHVKWLDLKRFDSGVDHSHRMELEPLIVNTDKAHAEWVAIVNHRVIDICNRQKEWYENCGLPGFDQVLWYQNKKRSDFGQFKPLFRLTEQQTYNAVEENWPFILLTLQEFIRDTLGDTGLPDLVKFVEKDGSRKGLDFDDFGVSCYEPEKIDPEKSYSLRARHTPHALRVSFVSDRMMFLPPSLIGEYMTGQTERLVHFYNVVDTTNRKTHYELLAEKLAEGILQSKRGVAPEIATRAAKINSEILDTIESDPIGTISTYGLISLSAVQDDMTGIEIIKAKKNARLAFNDTHICPFDNTCPKEVVKDYGANRPCSICPYAIRSASHLPGISAAKDRAYELVVRIKKRIDTHKSVPIKQRNEDEIEKLVQEYDMASTDAFALEFTERQLYELHKAKAEGFIVGNDSKLKEHFEKIEVGELDYILKRLIDIQNYPSMNSEDVEMKFAYARKKLLMIEGDLEGLLEQSEEPESAQLLSLIKSMMEGKNLTVGEVFALAKEDLTMRIKKQSEIAANSISFFPGEVS